MFRNDCKLGLRCIIVSVYGMLSILNIIYHLNSLNITIKLVVKKLSI